MQGKYKNIRNKIKKRTTNIQTSQKSNTFYKRIENWTNVIFIEAELKLLDKGLIYNLHYKHKDWIKTLTTEADTAIHKMHVSDQIYTKQINNIQKLINKQITQKESR
jgi:hypothetical protein